MANSLLVTHYPKGTTIYCKDDPSETLYIIRKGKVTLLDPQANLEPLKHFDENDIFGQFSF